MAAQLRYAVEARALGLLAVRRFRALARARSSTSGDETLAIRVHSHMLAATLWVSLSVEICGAEAVRGFACCRSPRVHAFGRVGQLALHKQG